MDAVLVSTAAGLATYIIMPSFLHLLKRGGASSGETTGSNVPLGSRFLVHLDGLADGGILGLSALLSPSAERRAAADLWLLLSATGLGYSLLGLLDDLVGTAGKQAFWAMLGPLSRTAYHRGSQARFGGSCLWFLYWQAASCLPESSERHWRCSLSIVLMGRLVDRPRG